MVHNGFSIQHYSQASYVKTQLKWTLRRRSPWEWVTGEYCNNATKGRDWGILHSNRIVLLGQNSLWFLYFWSKMSVYFFSPVFGLYLISLLCYYYPFHIIILFYLILFYLFFFNLFFSTFWLVWWLFNIFSN